MYGRSDNPGKLPSANRVTRYPVLAANSGRNGGQQRLVKDEGARVTGRVFIGEEEGSDRGEKMGVLG